MGAAAVKLLFCTSCGDVKKLQYHARLCECGRSMGKYLSDGVRAEIFGESARVILIDNHNLVAALRGEPYEPPPAEPGGTDLWAQLAGRDHPRIERLPYN